MKPTTIKLACIAFVMSIGVLLSISSCAAKTHLQNSRIVPAAKGTVQVKLDNNKIYVIDIEISNLAPSTRLTPPYNAYVVWLIANDNSAKNLGQLNSSDDFMSKNLRAKFETVSSSRPAKIVITAENNPRVLYPTFTDIILTTSYLHLKK